MDGHPAAGIERPTSAPPTAGFGAVPPPGDDLEAMRGDPAYSQWYYAQNPRDPRAPPPYFSKCHVMNNQQGNKSSSKQGGIQVLQSDNSEEEEGERPETTPAVFDAEAATAMMPNPKSLVDKIQEDFPRTPSPVYGKEISGLKALQADKAAQQGLAPSPTEVNSDPSVQAQPAGGAGGGGATPLPSTSAGGGGGGGPTATVLPAQPATATSAASGTTTTHHGNSNGVTSALPSPPAQQQQQQGPQGPTTSNTEDNSGQQQHQQHHQQQQNGLPPNFANLAMQGQKGPVGAQQNQQGQTGFFGSGNLAPGPTANGGGGYHGGQQQERPLASPQQQQQMMNLQSYGMMGMQMPVQMQQLPPQQQQQAYYPYTPHIPLNYGGMQFYGMDDTTGAYYPPQAIPPYEQAPMFQPQPAAPPQDYSSAHVLHQQSHPPAENHKREKKSHHRREPRTHDDHTPRSQLMEEFRTQKNRRWELRDLVQHIVEFSKDQEGSRLIQRKLESNNCADQEKELVFGEIYKDALLLMTDVFGNYVIQKLFEHGLPSHRVALAKVLQGHVLHLTLQTYGCRVIQKALEVMNEEDQKMVSTELDGNVLRCVLDQNGNHVIQKCIERIPPYNVRFIVQAFIGNVQNLAVHAYGCRVIQRILEYCEDHQEVIQPILDEVLDNVHTLVRDQYGNYVVQHVLINGRPVYQYAIIERLRGDILDLSTHKFASNVVEKMFQHGSRECRHSMVMDLIKPLPPDGVSAVLQMMKDQYANYVVQKILDVADESASNGMLTPEQRRMIIDHIKPHLNSLKRYTYGKHITSRIEKLSNNQQRI